MKTLRTDIPGSRKSECRDLGKAKNVYGNVGHDKGFGFVPGAVGSQWRILSRGMALI